jgi:ankyrin repeat protein
MLHAVDLQVRYRFERFLHEQKCPSLANLSVWKTCEDFYSCNSAQKSELFTYLIQRFTQRQGEQDEKLDLPAQSCEGLAAFFTGQLLSESRREECVAYIQEQCERGMISDFQWFQGVSDDKKSKKQFRRESRKSAPRNNNQTVLPNSFFSSQPVSKPQTDPFVGINATFDAKIAYCARRTEKPEWHLRFLQLDNLTLSVYEVHPGSAIPEQPSLKFLLTSCSLTMLDFDLFRLDHVVTEDDDNQMLKFQFILNGESSHVWKFRVVGDYKKRVKAIRAVHKSIRVIASARLATACITKDLPNRIADIHRNFIFLQKIQLKFVLPELNSACRTIIRSYMDPMNIDDFSYTMADLKTLVNPKPTPPKTRQTRTSSFPFFSSSPASVAETKVEPPQPSLYVPLLHHAVIANIPSAILNLLNNCANPNIMDENNCTPLHVAVERHHFEAVTVLLNARGIVLDAIDNRGLAPFHLSRDTDVIRLLVCFKADINIRTRSRMGGDALLHLVTDSTFSLAQCLISQGCQIDPVNIRGFTPLSLAARDGHFSVVQELIEAKAEVNFQNKLTFETPLHLACMNGNSDIVEILLENSAEIIPNANLPSHLVSAIKAGSLECVQVLVNYNADPCQLDPDRKTPLHHACITGNLDIIKFLCDQPPVKENVNAIDKHFFAPMNYVALLAEPRAR